MKYRLAKSFRFNNCDFEITFREIICSISIVSVMIIIGMLISNKITNHSLDKVEKYNKAVKIIDSELFQYGMNTNIGDAFVYGELQAIDTVTYPELDDNYMVVKRTKERYTRHTRTVTYTDSNGKTKTRTETYWSWDVVGSEELRCHTVRFCGTEFSLTKFNTPTPSHITTIKESSSIRYKYAGVPKIIEGTIYTHLSDHDISENNDFYQMSLTDTVKHLTTKSKVGVIIFWVFWILSIVIIVCLFYYAENKWLK